MTHFTREEFEKFIWRVANGTPKEDIAALTAIAGIVSGEKPSRKAWERIEDIFVSFPAEPTRGRRKNP